MKHLVKRIVDLLLLPFVAVGVFLIMTAGLISEWFEES